MLVNSELHSPLFGLLQRPKAAKRIAWTQALKPIAALQLFLFHLFKEKLNLMTIVQIAKFTVVEIFLPC
jgi:hypothetical protein